MEGKDQVEGREDQDYGCHDQALGFAAGDAVQHDAEGEVARQDPAGDIREAFTDQQRGQAGPGQRTYVDKDVQENGRGAAGAPLAPSAFSLV